MDATPPPDPVKTDTAEFDYEFIGWIGSFTAVDGNRSVTAAYSQTLREYEVIFLDADGTTVLKSENVPYGSAATPPEDPTRLGYRFLGWEGDYGCISGPTTIRATYRSDALVTVVRGMFDYDPSEEEIEQQIQMLHALLDPMTEDQMVAMIQAAMGLQEAMLGGDLTAFQSQYALAKSTGMNAQRIAQVLIRLIAHEMEIRISDYDPGFLYEEIEGVQNQISQLQNEMSALIDGAHQYCAVSVSPSDYDACVSYFDHALVYFEQSEVFNRQLNDVLYPGSMRKPSDPTWWELSYNLNQYLFYKYEEIDLAVSQSYYDQYLLVLSLLSASERAAYEPLCLSYLNLEEYHYTMVIPWEDAIDGHLDADSQFILSRLDNEWINPYQIAYWLLQEYRYALWEKQDWLAQMEMTHRMMLGGWDYLEDPTNQAKLEMLVGMVFGSLDSLVDGMDPETFALISGLISGSIDPKSLEWTPETIDGYLNQLTNLLQTMRASVTPEEMQNLITVAKDIVDLYVSALDVPDLTKVYLHLKYRAAVDRYAWMLNSSIDEIIDLLESATPEKIEIVMENIALLSQAQVSNDPFTMIFPIAKIIDTVFYSGEFDAVMISGYVVDIYFDVRYGMEYDSELQESIKTTFQTEITTLIDLAHQIGNINPELPSGEDLNTLFRFIGGIQWLQETVQWGFETIPERPIPGYDPEQFSQLIYDLTGLETDPMTLAELKSRISDAFELTEEETYYELMALLWRFQALQGVESFADFQDWYGTLAAIGYDPEMMAHLLAETVSLAIDLQLMADPYAETLAYFEQALADQEAALAAWEDRMDEYGLTINLQIGWISDEAARADALALWIELMNQWNLWIAYEENYNQVVQDFWEVWDPGTDMTLWDLMYFKEQAILFGSPSYLDETLRDQAQADFDAIWVGLSPEYQAMYTLILDPAIARWVHDYTVLLPAYGALYENGEGYGELVLAMESAYFQLYWDYWTFRMMWAERDQLAQELADWEAMDAEIMQKRAFLEGLQTLLSFPENQALLEAVILTWIEEGENLLYWANADTVILLMQILRGEVAISSWDAATIATHAHEVSDLIGLLFTTIDPMEKAQMEDLLTMILFVQIDADPRWDEAQRAILKDIVSEGVTTYLSGVLEGIPVITDFLDNLTPAKVQTILENIGIINGLGEAEDTLSNNIRAVAIAKIVLAVGGDGTLDLNTLIHIGLGGYLTFTYDFTSVWPDARDTAVADLQELMSEILLQADVIDGYDPYFLQAGEAEQINAFHLLIEDLIAFTQNGPSTLPPAS
jgi:hypothetical protein